MKPFLLFCMFTAICRTGLAQDVQFEQVVSDYLTAKKYPDATVKVSSGIFRSVTYKVNEKGKVKFQLDGGRKYKITVSGPGKVPRHFCVDLSNSETTGEDQPLFGSCDISLFEKRRGVDYSYIKSNSITTFSYNEAHTRLDYDRTTVVKMLKEVERVSKEKE